MIRRIFIVMTMALLGACATSPLGRSQLQLLPEDQMAQMGASAYREVKQETGVSRDSRLNRYVSCVADAITRQVSPSSAWEVSVFNDDSPNAFALPGGKIGVNSGMLKVAENQDQLATIIGHEVAHVIARHANERVSQQYATQAGLQLLSALAGANTPVKQNLMGLLGVGAQYGVLLPYGRIQESEADKVGLDLMAQAGFDPRESVDLWQNMRSAGGEGPPEFLSTHPSGERRISDLNARMTQAMPLYERARASGKKPNCRR